MYYITLPYDFLKANLYTALTLAAATTTLTVSAPGANEVAFKANHYYVTADSVNGTVKLPTVAALKNAGVDSGVQAGSVDVAFTNNATSTGALKIQDSAGTQIAYLPPGASCLIRMSGTTTAVISGGVDIGFARFIAAVANTTPGGVAVLPITVAAGAGNTDIAANLIPRAFEVFSVEFVSAGATGGTVQLQTAGGGANVTDAMVPGNANIVTRPTTMANRAFAANAGMRVNAAVGNPGGTMYVYLLAK